MSNISQVPAVASSSSAPASVSIRQIVVFDSGGAGRQCTSGTG